jgi:hypothetical protein
MTHKDEIISIVMNHISEIKDSPTLLKNTLDMLYVAAYNEAIRNLMESEANDERVKFIIRKNSLIS